VIKKTWLPSLIIVICVVIQSTLLRNISILNVTPDIALILLVFFSNNRGSMRGQIAGFASGIVEDFLSLSPMGFHAFIKTVIGYLYGFTHGKIFIGPIFMPMIFVGVATFTKSLLGFIIFSIFLKEYSATLFDYKFLIELGENVFLAPFIFAFMGLFKIFRAEDRVGYKK